MLNPEPPEGDPPDLGQSKNLQQQELPNGNREFSAFMNDKQPETDTNGRNVIELTLTPDELGNIITLSYFFCILYLKFLSLTGFLFIIFLLTNLCPFFSWVL